MTFLSNALTYLLTYLFVVWQNSAETTTAGVERLRPSTAEATADHPLRQSRHGSRLSIPRIRLCRTQTRLGGLLLLRALSGRVLSRVVGPSRRGFAPPGPGTLTFGPRSPFLATGHPTLERNMAGSPETMLLAPGSPNLALKNFSPMLSGPC